ncbi:MAG: BlaI/MecI/CopY family transcriptional regulator [Clostridia bacterium]|nr:BlaI/MecI/CopY family transcriptional regulator [Clostridia bacterium]
MKDSLSKQQWLIMEALWNRSPMFLSELMEEMAGRGKWAHTTLLTHLKKLVEEGLVTYETVRGSRLYSAAVSREEGVRNESRSLLSRLTESSAALLVSNMIREGSLSQSERDELRDLIDQLAEQDKENGE